jgi:DNA repair protein RadC
MTNETQKMYRIPVVKVMMVKDSSQASTVRQVKCPEDAASLAQAFLAGVDREHFIVLLLDTKNKVTGINTVSIGSLNSSIVHPREVFKPAIIANAAGIILAHNHPSGDPTPSREDIEVTRQLIEAGKLLQIPVLDHVVLGDDCHCSLKQRALM